MVSRLWTPLTGQRARLSTKDGNCGQKRLDSPLMLWKVTRKRPRFPNSIIGSMEREWDIMSHGKTAKPSFTSLSMINGEGMGHNESWKNSKTLIHQSEYDRLEEHQKEGKYSSEQIESYFTLNFC